MNSPTQHNPYIVGEPVSRNGFYGYDDVIKKILTNQQHITLVLGMRRIGKTSILQRIANEAGGIYLNLQRTGGDWSRFKAGLIRSITKSAANIAWLTHLDSLKSGDDICDTLEILNDIAERAEARIFLALDETEVLIQLGEKDPALLQMFQSILGDSSHNLRFIFASAKQLTDLDSFSFPVGHGSPFLNIFPPPVYVSGMHVQDVADLICQTKNRFGSLSVSNQVIEMISQLTNNHPYFIQLVCFRLWQVSPNPRNWTVDEKVLDTDPDLHRILKVDFDYLTNTEREIIRKVMLKQELSNIDPIYIEGLVQLGYLRKTDSRVDIGNYFLKRWLQTQDESFWKIRSGVSEEATLRLYSKEHSNPMDPNIGIAMIAVVEKTTEFLFNQANELLRDWRENRKKSFVDSNTSIPNLNLHESAQQTIDQQTAKIELSEKIKKLLDSNQYKQLQMKVREANSLLLQVENLHYLKLSYQEESAKAPGLDDRIAIRRRIEDLDTQIATKAESMRSILESIAEHKLYVPALDE